MREDIAKIIKLAQATYNGSIIKLAEEIAVILENAYLRLGYLEKAEPVKACTCDSCIDKAVAKKAKSRTTRKAETNHESGIQVQKMQKKVSGTTEDKGV